MVQYWGNSYGFGYTIADADALAWADGVASVDGAQLPDAIKAAMDSYVQALKPTGLGGAPGSIWSQAVQLLVPCGPATLAGALRPLKGAAPTNANFVSGNYNRKNGLGKASNANAYLNNNVAVNVLGATSHALFAYGAISASSGDRVLCGRFDGANGASLVSLDEWASYVSGRAFRSGTFTQSPTLEFPVVTSTAAATCIIGSRTSATNAALYVDGSTVSNSTNRSITLSGQNVFTFALNNNGTPLAFSSAILQVTGIFSAGLNATQADALRSATAAYVAAVAAAIP